MDNGRNLIDMVCEAFESTEEEAKEQGGGFSRGGGGGEDGSGEEAEQQACFNFSERPQQACCCCHSACTIGREVRRGLWRCAGRALAQRSHLTTWCCLLLPPCPPARLPPPAGTFRVLLLRKRGQLVSAAAVRAFGAKFAEVPFVATRDGYRREGHCRRLMQVGAAGGCWLGWGGAGRQMVAAAVGQAQAGGAAAARLAQL